VQLVLASDERLDERIQGIPVDNQRGREMPCRTAPRCDSQTAVPEPELGERT
jgi:hypothetical protein